MKIKINQLDEEVIEKNVKMQQLHDQLHHQLVNRHQESPTANKISVGSQTKQVGIIGYVLNILQIHLSALSPVFSKYLYELT